MAGPLVIIDMSDVREGRLGELRTAFRRLASFVEEREPRAVGYHVSFSPDGAHVTVLQMHPDSESAEYHMEIAAAQFRGFAELLTLRTIDVYGVPSQGLVDRLRAKARMLGDAVLAVHKPNVGFMRLGPL